LEIGPGLGSLTELLRQSGATVLAIEKDDRLCDFLTERFRDCDRLTVRRQDALEALARREIGWTDWKLVSNLPYSVASPILVELVRLERRPIRIVTTLQLEVAHRVCAKAGDPDYGIMTLLIQLRYRTEMPMRIPSGCFFPEPGVDSGCVVLARRETPLLPPELEPRFARIVKRGFSERRKIMKKLLKGDWPEPTLDAAWQHLNLAPQVRAEKVDLESFVALTRFLERSRARAS
jgi:16S rRNA (adenine1518-N6/adenine1519-N6)-dimethyltransferase